ncbi:MAG: FUSC family protein [Staphylococcaceae bacterium]|uniref:FUSC family protein n=1 Tax=Staphylococcus capitis TaxID=29388 RepID=UPI00345750BA|nr:FUSC family protein [Staphylococcaceae bacterium]MBW4842733.1 FUSC family protein [Staphylococcaceae bacterium]
MNHVLNSLTRVDKSKIDYYKGLRQGLLLIIPALIGYFFGFFNFGLLISTGTLAHVYVFKGSTQSMLRTVIICSLSFSLCMMLGTLTIIQPIVFGLILLVVVAVPYYIFNALKVAGPSSTFFLVTYCLPINLPHAPEEALLRGLGILIGGILATITVMLTILFTKVKAEDRAINADFATIHNLLHHYNDPEAFKTYARNAVTEFRTSEKLLITSTSGGNGKLSSRFQKLILLHTAAQGIYSELLELNEKNVRPIPQDLIEMMDYIYNGIQQPRTSRPWTKPVDVPSEFENLLNHILKIDEMVHANDNQIEHEADIRKPLYSKRIYQNLTFDSIVFRNALQYTVIMAIAIFIALGFNIQKAYWVPLSAHTVLLSNMTTIRSLDRALARGIGTIIGALILSGILALNINPLIAILIMGVSAVMTEAFVAANYAFAVIFITTQVIMLNGLASHNLSIEIAYTRIIDVILGIVITVIGIFLVARNTASSMLPGAIAELVRKEATLFHYLFSKNKYETNEVDKGERLNLNVKISNVTQMYNSANGELFSNKEVVRYYYPSIFALEEISFMLERAMNNKHRITIDDEQMGEYLLAFENIAKHFQLQGSLEERELSHLPQYNYIRSALINIQRNSVHARKDITENEEEHHTSNDSQLKG